MYACILFVLFLKFLSPQTCWWKVPLDVIFSKPNLWWRLMFSKSKTLSLQEIELNFTSKSLMSTGVVCPRHFKPLWLPVFCNAVLAICMRPDKHTTKVHTDLKCRTVRLLHVTNEHSLHEKISFSSSSF